MTALTVPLLVIGTALTVLLFVFGVRRLLGLRLGLLRTTVAGVIAFLVASPIITALAGNSVKKRSGILPGLWFVILGVAIALLIGMTILVVAETFVPSGTLPGPAYLARSLRKRVGRTKPDPRPPRAPRLPAGRTPDRTANPGRSRPPGPLPSPRPRRGRRSLHKARPGARHPPRPAPRRVRH
jgi:hypothetical protein